MALIKNTECNHNIPSERERLRDSRGEDERELAGRRVAPRPQLRPPRRGGPVRRPLLRTQLVPGQFMVFTGGCRQAKKTVAATDATYLKPLWFQNEPDESTFLCYKATKKWPDGTTCVFLTTWGVHTASVGL